MHIGICTCLVDRIFYLSFLPHVNLTVGHTCRVNPMPWQDAGAEHIIDIATLTGACIVSLGNDYAGMWSNDDAMAAAIKSAADASGEKMWQMPLAEEYEESIKSKIADLKNIGGKGGGSITAALFLKHFVDKAKWAHLDIAGPVWNDASGATGYGAKVLANWVADCGK